MAHHVFINGRRYDPKEAIQTLLRGDTDLVCPACNSPMVGTKDALTGIQFTGEIKQWVPRQQDRWCHDCGHRWMTVLPPESYFNNYR